LLVPQVLQVLPGLRVKQAHKVHKVCRGLLALKVLLGQQVPPVLRVQTVWMVHLARRGPKVHKDHRVDLSPRGYIPIRGK
jgi:hypothetical protein